MCFSWSLMLKILVCIDVISQWDGICTVALRTILLPFWGLVVHNVSMQVSVPYNTKFNTRVDIASGTMSWYLPHTPGGKRVGVGVQKPTGSVGCNDYLKIFITRNIQGIIGKVWQNVDWVKYM